MKDKDSLVKLGYEFRFLGEEERPILNVNEGDQEPFFYIYSSAGYDPLERVDLGTEGILRIELKKVSPLLSKARKVNQLFHPWAD